MLKISHLKALALLMFEDNREINVYAIALALS
jgi:hypothetical protein